MAFVVMYDASALFGNAERAGRGTSVEDDRREDDAGRTSGAFAG